MIHEDLLHMAHVKQLVQYIQAWTWCQDEGNPNQGQGQTASITGPGSSLVTQSPEAKYNLLDC